METKERMTPQQINRELPQFYGTTQWYRFSPLFRDLLITDGVKFVCDEAGGHGAYWFLDVIGSYQPKLRGKHPFQVWKLQVNILESEGVVSCEDGNGNVLVTQKIPSTDFNLPTITFWLEFGENGVIMLPSER